MKYSGLVLLASVIGTPCALGAQGGGISEVLRAVEDGVLRAPGGAPNDHLGVPVAMSGDTAVVGARGANADLGAVYVFTRGTSGWTFQQEILPGDVEGFFPHSVAIDGDTLVAGAAGDDDMAAGAGAVYVYTRSGTTWTQQAKLYASDADEGDGLGMAVAVGGDWLVAGAPFDDEVGTDEGAVYVFHRSGASWGAPVKLPGWSNGYRSRFGLALAMDGDTFAVGAPCYSFDDFTLSDDGRVEVYERSGSQWSPTAVFNGPFATRFGRALDLDGDTIAVGAPYGYPEDEPGSVWVYARNGSGWSFEDAFTSSDALYGQRFGLSVALAGERLTVCAGYGDDAYLFVRDGSDWQEQMKIAARDGETLVSCAMDGDRILAGATDGAAGAGLAYVFRLEEPLGSVYCSPAVPNSSGAPGVMTAFGSTLTTDDDLVLAAWDLPTGSNTGYFLMGTGTSTFVPPGSAGPICITPGLKRLLPPGSNTNELPGGYSRAVGTSGPQTSLIAPGSTWNFQAWHRDSAAGTSNLTDAVSVTFL